MLFEQAKQRLFSVIPQKLLLAVLTIVFGVVLARALKKLTEHIYKRLSPEVQGKTGRIGTILQMGVFLASLILALGFLQLDFATTIALKIVEISQSLFIAAILVLLGYALVSLVIDIAYNIVRTLGREYLAYLQISPRMVRTVFWLAKAFLMLSIISASLRAVNLYAPMFDAILTGVGFAAVAVIGLLIAYAYKDWAANILLRNVVEKKVVKLGQHIVIDNKKGEIISIDNHGVRIQLQDEQDIIVPNAQFVKQTWKVKRTKPHIRELEQIVKRYTTQKKSACGPAAASMMLSFFGYDVSQQQLAKLSSTTTRPEGVTTGSYGTEPDNLIKSVQTVTTNNVLGMIVPFDNIIDLEEELLSWLADGALLILWYKKSVLFPEKGRFGHYVLGVGVEHGEVLVVDTSVKTSGAFMVAINVMEEAMGDHDRKRGYLVFAKKGSPAYWRIKNKLQYANPKSYAKLSKTFERELKKLLKKTKLTSHLISPLVTKDDVRNIWKPKSS